MTIRKSAAKFPALRARFAMKAITGGISDLAAFIAKPAVALRAGMRFVGANGAEVPMTQQTPSKPDHGGGLDAAALRFGGRRGDWLDLSTGINPRPYPVPDISPNAWAALPDEGAQNTLIHAARAFWNVPDTAAIIAAPGASALIAMMPLLAPAGRVHIPAPTYNEHARAFAAQGWSLTETAPDAQVLVHPNNPDGRLWHAADLTAPLTVIDESFCDVTPDQTLIAQATRPGTIILKSFGKFWGLAGLRLGFAIGDPALIAKLTALLGPWPVSGPALQIAASALNDTTWATATRARLTADAARLDQLMGLRLIGGTPLFRLYDHPDAAQVQTALAQHHIWTRTFPYNPRFLRLGLPDTPHDWARLSLALHEAR